MQAKLPLLLLPLAVSAILACAAGCASRGNPQPPSLHLPALATELRAQRVSNQVLLTWTIPNKTTDGLLLHDPVTVILCRDLSPLRSANPPACTPVRRLSATPGETHVADILPPALITGEPRLLVYRIELCNAKNRSAGPSSPVLAPAGQAPADPGVLTVTASPHGAMVHWQLSPYQPSVVQPAMELTRTLIANDPSPATPLGKHKTSTPRLSSTKEYSSPVVLRATFSGSSPVRDAGGIFDPTALPHNTYTYIAQRVLPVTLAGHAYELRSAPSPAVTFIDKDVFPPRPPTGLQSIASAPLNGPPSIDLSWESNLEPDILGYNLFRSDTPDGPFTRLNSSPIPSPTFRDLTAASNHTYRYRVTAVDQNHNESLPSSAIQDLIQAP